MERVEKSALTIERRARRRWWWWTVVALVLCLGAYLGWRTQNFGDPRYVGRWNIVQVHSGRLRTELEFFADGTGAMYEVVDSQPEAVMDFRWGVENELLQIDNDPTAVKQTLLQRIELQINGWLFGWRSNWQPGRQTRDYRVSAVDSDRLMLMAANPGAESEHFEIERIVE